LKKVVPDLGVRLMSASANSSLALAMEGIAKAKATMNAAIAELKYLTVTSC
jgi:hypothetical protein